MKDISIYFSPIEIEIQKLDGTIGNSIEIHTENNFPELTKKGIALIYVPEYRNGEIEFHGKYNENFRKHFPTQRIKLISNAYAPYIIFFI